MNDCFGSGWNWETFIRMGLRCPYCKTIQEMEDCWQCPANPTASISIFRVGWWLFSFAMWVTFKRPKALFQTVPQMTGLPSAFLIGWWFCWCWAVLVWSWSPGSYAVQEGSPVCLPPPPRLFVTVLLFLIARRGIWILHKIHSISDHLPPVCQVCIWHLPYVIFRLVPPPSLTVIALAWHF